VGWLAGAVAGTLLCRTSWPLGFSSQGLGLFSGLASSCGSSIATFLTQRIGSFRPPYGAYDGCGPGGCFAYPISYAWKEDLATAEDLADIGAFEELPELEPDLEWPDRNMMVTVGTQRRRYCERKRTPEQR